MFWTDAQRAATSDPSFEICMPSAGAAKSLAAAAQKLQNDGFTEDEEGQFE